MKYFVIDAFAERAFQGNSAGVCVLEESLEVSMMQKIAAENHLPETAFVQKEKEGYGLRWFTPYFEIDLCGHATLAAAAVITHFIDPTVEEIRFQTIAGDLTVIRKGEIYELYLPAWEMTPMKCPKIVPLGCAPIECWSGRDIIFVLPDEQAVLKYIPDYAALRQLSDWLGVVITARGDNTDFVSCYFCPELAEEDQVTGSSQCNLIPYWAKRLQKDQLLAKQLYKRGGTLYCTYLGEYVKIAGKAVVYLQGEIYV